MRRFLLAGVAIVMLGCAAASVTPRTAHADVYWCWDDPVVIINGVTVTFTVGGTADAATVASTVSSLTYVISVPQSATVSVVSVGGVFPEHIKINTNQGAGNQVTITAAFNASKSLSAREEVKFLTSDLINWGNTTGNSPQVTFSLVN